MDETKLYWRTRNTVDVVIVHHTICKTFEVIAYEPSLDIEAPRLYLNEEILVTKVVHNGIDSRISFAKRNDVPGTENLLGGIVYKTVSDFVLNRLLIKELVIAEKKLIVKVKITDEDIRAEPDLKDLVVACPKGLVAHPSSNCKHIMQGVVVAAMQALERDKKTLRESRAEMRLTPAVRDRWRMPLVLIKVLRGVHMCFADRKIFEKIKSNLADNEAGFIVGSDSETQPNTPFPHATSLKLQSCSRQHAPSILGSAQGHQRRALTAREQRCEQRESSFGHRRGGAEAQSPTSVPNVSFSRFDTESSRGKVNSPDLKAQTATTSTWTPSQKIRKAHMPRKPYAEEADSTSSTVCSDAATVGEPADAVLVAPALKNKPHRWRTTYLGTFLAILSGRSGDVTVAAQPSLHGSANLGAALTTWMTIFPHKVAPAQ